MLTQREGSTGPGFAFETSYLYTNRQLPRFTTRRVFSFPKRFIEENQYKEFINVKNITMNMKDHFDSLKERQNKMKEYAMKNLSHYKPKVRKVKKKVHIPKQEEFENRSERTGTDGKRTEDLSQGVDREDHKIKFINTT